MKKQQIEETPTAELTLAEQVAAAKREVANLQTEKEALSAKLLEAIEAADPDRQIELGVRADRIDVFIRAVGVKLIDLEIEELKQRREKRYPLLPAARERFEAAKERLEAAQAEFEEADAGVCNVQYDNSLLAEQIRNKEAKRRGLIAEWSGPVRVKQAA
jgi:predicted  nucleic acid-binding Zn-ribbon protein